MRGLGGLLESKKDPPKGENNIPKGIKRTTTAIRRAERFYNVDKFIICLILENYFYMKVILIQGRKDAGKTTLCETIGKWLENNGYPKQDDVYYSKGAPDFYRTYKGIYSGVDNTLKGKEIRIVVNTGCDLFTSNQEFETYYKSRGTIDILITSIRSIGHHIENKKDVRQQIKDIYTPNMVGTEDVIDLDSLNRNTGEIFCDYIDRILKNEFVPKF